jgi:hypothetical protein
VASGPPVLNQIPYLNRLFRNVHGMALGDVDNDGKADPYIAGGSKWRDELYDLKSRTPPEPDPAAALQAAVDAAKANLQVAQADLELAVKQSLRGGFPPGQDPAQAARAKAAQAQAQLDVAEARLRQTHKEKAGSSTPQEKWKVQGDADRIIRDYDRLLQDYWAKLPTKSEPSDLEFLRRLSLDVRGTPPSKVEENYFQADKDPKKREKMLQLMLRSDTNAPGRARLIEQLLADPEVQKRWTAIWQERLAAEQKANETAALARWVNDTGHDQLGRLLNELITTKRPDDQVLDALCLATLARFPTETERRLILGGLKDQPDRRAAWDAVLRSLASTQEAKAHAEALSKRAK